MQDIQRLKRELLKNPEDMETLKVLEREARRREDEDLRIFCEVFKKETFSDIRQNIQEKGIMVSSYFSNEEWDIIRSNNKEILILGEEDFSFGTSLSSAIPTFQSSWLQEGEIPHLRKISITKNDDISLDSNKFPKLEKVLLYECVIKDLDLSNPSITFLHYMCNVEMDTLVWKCIPNLRVFYFRNTLGGLNYIDPLGRGIYQIDFLDECYNLEEVHIHRARVSPKFLGQSKIRKLTLFDCQLTDVSSLNADNLEYLDISYNPIEDLTGNFPKLKEFRVFNTPNPVNFDASFPVLQFFNTKPYEIGDELREFQGWT